MRGGYRILHTSTDMRVDPLGDYTVIIPTRVLVPRRTTAPSILPLFYAKCIVVTDQAVARHSDYIRVRTFLMSGTQYVISVWGSTSVIFANRLLCNRMGGFDVILEASGTDCLSCHVTFSYLTPCGCVHVSAHRRSRYHAI